MPSLVFFKRGENDFNILDKLSCLLLNAKLVLLFS